MRGSTISCVLATALTACAVDETPGDAVVESELSVPDGIWVPNAFGASATVSSQELRSTTDPGRALVTGLWA
ncbi:MAG: hypothetical protein ABI867_06810, partial [Kofleriaceae bacterium]